MIEDQLNTVVQVRMVERFCVAFAADYGHVTSTTDLPFSFHRNIAPSGLRPTKY